MFHSIIQYSLINWGRAMGIQKSTSQC